MADFPKWATRYAVDDDKDGEPWMYIVMRLDTHGDYTDVYRCRWGTDAAELAARLNEQEETRRG